MENGKMKLNLTDLDLPALLERAAVSMRPLCGRRELLVLPCAPLTVKADAELIARVVQNLVSNALKFAPKDGGYVRLSAAPAPGAVRVSVENNGPFIPPEYHASIFEKFGQADPHGVKRPYSTGLGLNFCKLAIEAHGGRIGVDSAPDRPTVFWFELKA
jgi:signal transduction histidine kinase